MASWTVQDARGRFDELLDASLKDGPQTVTKEGVETVVIVPADEWRRRTQSPPPKYANLKEWLMAPEARFDDFDTMIPPRGGHQRRPPPELD